MSLVLVPLWLAIVQHLVALAWWGCVVGLITFIHTGDATTGWLSGALFVAMALLPYSHYWRSEHERIRQERCSHQVLNEATS
ncbi:MAG: hypothetical protein WC553_02145 [Patescibacteria group bacterium]